LFDNHIIKVSIPVRGKRFKTFSFLFEEERNLLVSIPVRGKRFKTVSTGENQDDAIRVSIPVRGKRFKTANEAGFSVSAEEFPSP